MKPFLKELAETIIKNHAQLDSVTLVFPNRRAALYFRKYLSESLTKPAFAPHLLTIEDFIASFSTLKVPDKLELISRLYQSYHEIIRKKSVAAGEPNAEAEPFDQFYFWGDMLLRDFDETDKYMVNAEHLFKDLSNQKELDASFDFLTEEQHEFLKNFWDNFEENQSENKRKFLQVWRQLPEVYHHFKLQLLSKNIAYEGMLHRAVAENLSEGTTNHFIKENQSIKFVGFNALTTAEEKIISFFVEKNKAEVYWDLDDYYVNNKSQEAGKFFRLYQEHKILGATFPSDIPANFIKKKTTDGKPKVKLFGAAQPIGQAKLMAEVLQQQLKDFKPEETLIVLPDEKLLIPVLHGISGMVDALNVTMGFPLSSTPLFNLIEILVDLQITAKHDNFNHRQVLALLGHPYVIAADAVSPNNKRKEILKANWVHIPSGYLATEIELHRLIFKGFLQSENSADINRDLIQYLKTIVFHVGSLTNLSNFDKEYAFHFIKFFNRLEEILSSTKISDHGEVNLENKKLKNLEELNDEKEISKKYKTVKSALKSFLRLFRQLVNAHKIPFTGEPLRGLQVMGVLETRNLDFKNVFVLSLNEGAFPSINNKGSYIPFNIRRAYGLPTVDHQDAIYSYLFYRILQRAENIFLFYNSETDVLGQGEMSRYLQQLLFESGIPIEKKILHNPIQPLNINPIVIEKNASVMEALLKLNDVNDYFQGISPSTLNNYMECKLRFYFRHVARIKEPKEVQEELDARVLGNFLHGVMERFYKQISEKKKNKQIESSDFINYEATVERLIDEVFIEEYRLDPDKLVTYEGQRLVVKEIVKRFAHRIIEMDMAYAPFTIEALEQGGLTYTMPIDSPPYKAVLGGKIDRVDRKGDVVRIIDYKTGKDKMNFESVASLFMRDTKRNKAAFQTLLYALLYKRNFLNLKVNSDLKLIPGLINRMNLFDDEFTFGLKVGKELITDVELLLPEFEANVKKVFEEMFNPAEPFDQTSDLENCRNCPYGQLCYR